MERRNTCRQRGWSEGKRGAVSPPDILNVTSPAYVIHENKKGPSEHSEKPRKTLFNQRLFRFDCLRWANINTWTAIRAFVRIDNVNRIPFADRFNRAFRNTRTARNTCIGNFVRHQRLPSDRMFLKLQFFDKRKYQMNNDDAIKIFTATCREIIKIYSLKNKAPKAPVLQELSRLF